MSVYTLTHASFTAQLQEIWITALGERGELLVLAFSSMHCTTCKHSLNVECLPILACDSEWGLSPPSRVYPTTGTWPANPMPSKTPLQICSCSTLMLHRHGVMELLTCLNWEPGQVCFHHFTFENYEIKNVIYIFFLTGIECINKTLSNLLNQLLVSSTLCRLFVITVTLEQHISCTRINFKISLMTTSPCLQTFTVKHLHRVQNVMVTPCMYRVTFAFFLNFFSCEYTMLRLMNFIVLIHSMNSRTLEV